MNVVAARMYMYRFVPGTRGGHKRRLILLLAVSSLSSCTLCAISALALGPEVSAKQSTAHWQSGEKPSFLLLSQDSTETLLLVSLETTQETN